MADRTEAEKMEELLRKQSAQQSIEHERMQEEHERRLQLCLETAEVRIKEMRDSFEERKKDLLSQNDGLLGAVGRLHAENEDLKKKIASLEPALCKARESLDRADKEVCVAIEQAHQRYDEMVQSVRSEAKKEITHLKEKLAECQKRKK